MKLLDDVLAEIASVLQHGVAGPNMKALGDAYIAVTNQEQHPLDRVAEQISNLHDEAKETGDMPGNVDSGFAWGKTSLAHQEGVHPKLIEVANLALQFSTVDMSFFCGVRTKAEQLDAIRRGTTKTTKSKHFVQADGFGHAMDLVPIIGGLPKWDWEGCYRIAMAVDLAATHLGYAANITWGGAWDRTLDSYGGSADEYKKEVLGYQTRHPGPDFVDGPHFQWAD